MLQDFVHARQLFSACLELVTEFSPKLRQVMLNEMLLLEVRAHETMAAEGSKERPPPDLVSRVRGYLEMRIHGEIRHFGRKRRQKSCCTSRPSSGCRFWLCGFSGTVLFNLG